MINTDRGATVVAVDLERRGRELARDAEIRVIPSLPLCMSPEDKQDLVDQAVRLAVHKLIALIARNN